MKTSSNPNPKREPESVKAVRSSDVLGVMGEKTNEGGTLDSNCTLESIGWEKINPKASLTEILRSLTCPHPLSCIGQGKTSPMLIRLLRMHDQWKLAGEPNPEVLLESYHPSPIERLCSYFESVTVTPNDQKLSHGAKADGSQNEQKL